SALIDDKTQGSPSGIAETGVPEAMAGAPPGVSVMLPMTTDAVVVKQPSRLADLQAVTGKLPLLALPLGLPRL
ncbi:MAG: hypothetical protein M1830_005315, partial [Pleopsidium flavum]